MQRPDFSEGTVAQHWDKNADVWAEHVRQGWDAYREHFNNPAFLRFIGAVEGKRILDAGCGEGYNTRLLAQRGASLTGIDISGRMIELARQEEQHNPLGIRYEIASFTDLRLFDDDAFDTIVSFMAFMDSPNLKRTFQELVRVLRPEGELCLSILHPCFMTQGFSWIGGETTNDLRLAVAQYFNDEPRVECWRFSKGSAPVDTPQFVVPRFPRTLSEYVNTLIKTGFQLVEIEEPRPTENACEEHPWLRRWRDHAAIYLYIRARKLSDDD